MDDCEKAFAFRRPHFEFHGACAGCGETAYITNLTRLYGSRMIIANATGCSSIYGFSFPYSPYNTDEKGHGPAWANSLFEDNAEFGFGMVVALQQRRDRIKEAAARVAASDSCPAGLKEALNNWIAHAHEVQGSEEAGEKLKQELAKMNCDCPDITLLKQKDNQEIFAKPVLLIVGGDGWAYDIGFCGLDHIMASGADFTLLVLDTEVYSNTGGQRSKATPLGAVAKFAASGKRQNKKDLAAIAMSYQDAYVASVNLGANFMHAIKTLREAVEYNGPALVVAYCPCIEHGMKSMAESMNAEKLAAQTGYWLSFNRYPGKKFNLVTPKPSKPINEFLGQQNRFVQLQTQRPQEAAALSQQLQEFVDIRYAQYANMAKQEVLTAENCKQ